MNGKLKTEYHVKNLHMWIDQTRVANYMLGVASLKIKLRVVRENMS